MHAPADRSSDTAQPPGSSEGTGFSEKFLREYLNSCAPPGRRDSCREIWVQYVEPFSDEILRDAYDSVAAIQRNGPQLVALEAHSDEIAWLVNFISPDGYIYVVQSGGSDAVIAPSKKVTIYSRKGKIPGVFAWPSMNNRKQEQTPSGEKLFIDVGCTSKEEVLGLGVEIGDPIIFDEQTTTLNDRLYTGRALDNRVGGYIIAEVARRLRASDMPLPFSVCVINAVQEEVGLRGAEMMAHRLRPTIAIVVDVMNDTNTPRTDKTEKGDITVGAGPVLVTAPPIHPLLLDKLLATARVQEIPVQRMAMSRSTGTDADAFAYSRSGIATLLLGIPIKYMHSTVEAAHKADISAAIELLFHFIRSIDLEQLENEGLFGSSYAPKARRALDGDRAPRTECIQHH